MLTVHVIETVAPGTTPLGHPRDLTVRPRVGTGCAGVSRPGWGREARGRESPGRREPPRVGREPPRVRREPPRLGREPPRVGPNCLGVGEQVKSCYLIFARDMRILISILYWSLFTCLANTNPTSASASYLIYPLLFDGLRPV